MRTDAALHADGVQPWDDGPGLFETVRSAWILIAVLAVLGALLAYGWSSRQTPMYTAEARLLLAEPLESFSSVLRPSGDSSRYIRNQAEYMRSADLLASAAQIAGVDWDAEELRDQVSVDAESDVDLVSVEVEADSPQTAARLANAVAEAYELAVSDDVRAAADERIAELRASQTELEGILAEAQARLEDDPDDDVAQAEREAAAEQLSLIISRARQLSVEAALFAGPIEHLESAAVPLRQSSPRPLRSAAGGLLLGFGLGAMWAWWRGLGVSAAETRSKVEAILGAPLLGEIPEVRDLRNPGNALPTATDPESMAAEAYQFLMASLSPALRDWDAHTVLVTSPQPGDGKTLTCANLAIAASGDHRTVLLVDADARAQGLRRLAAPALSNPGDDAQPKDSARSQLLTWTPVRGLQIPMTVFGERRAEPAAFFRSPPFAKVMQRMRTSADLVLVDSPPLLAVADPSEIAEHVDAVLLVITPETTTDALHEVRRRLATIRAPLVGFVLNRADIYLSPYAYGYGNALDDLDADGGHYSGNGYAARPEHQQS